MGQVLGLISVPVVFLAGGVAWNAFRVGDVKMSFWAGVVFAIGAVLFIVAPKAQSTFEPECNRYSSFAEGC